MYSSKAYQCNIFFIRGSKTVPYLTGENITTSPTSPAAGQTTTSNAQESTTIVISIQESDSNTIQDHIPAIIGGSVGGIIVIVGVFVLYKYIYVKKMKYEGQKNGQINHFDHLLKMVLHRETRRMTLTLICIIVFKLEILE